MPAERPLQHPGRVALVALGALAASWLVAAQRPVPSWELRLTQDINGVPDAVATALWPVMQLGTVVAPLAVAAVLLVWKRDLGLALAAVATGLVAWFGAKVVKRLVGRGRPPAYLPDIHLRDGSGTGLGFISGHSAVAAGTAVVLLAALPRRARPAAVVVAAVVGIARIVHGVHFPADVVGGWAFGTLVGVGALEVLGAVPADRAAPATDAGTPVA